MPIRRKDTRVSTALRVFETGDTSSPSVTRNISVSGMFLVTKKDWPEGATVSLDIRHRYCDMTIRARVVHKQADGVGLAFVDPSEEQEKKLEFVVDSLLADGAWLDERRTKVRTPIGASIVWRVGTMEVQSGLRDLSRSGAFIETAKPPEVGSQVYVYLPAVGETVEARGCQATVMHRGDEGFGVEFVFPSEEFSEAIEALLTDAESPPEQE